MKDALDDIEIDQNGEISEDDLLKALKLVREMKAARKEKMKSSGVKEYTLTKEEYLSQRLDACEKSILQTNKIVLKVAVIADLLVRGYSIDKALQKYHDLYT